MDFREDFGMYGSHMTTRSRTSLDMELELAAAFIGRDSIVEHEEWNRGVDSFSDVSANVPSTHSTHGRGDDSNPLRASGENANSGIVTVIGDIGNTTITQEATKDEAGPAAGQQSVSTTATTSTQTTGPTEISGALVEYESRIVVVRGSEIQPFVIPTLTDLRKKVVEELKASVRESRVYGLYKMVRSVCVWAKSERMEQT